VKAQFFSLDLVVALALMLSASAIALHAFEALERSQPSYSSQAEAIAEAVASGGEPLSPVAFCTAYSDGSGDCAAFSCPADVFVARRIVSCAGAPCLLEVRSCE